MSLPHTDFAPLDRPVRRRGWIEVAACVLLICIGYSMGQIWHCVRYLMRSKP